MRALLFATALAGVTAHAHADECRTLTVDFLPAESANADVTLRMPLQIVAWLETADGTFVDTVFITQSVGTYGLGNRPGRFDFNSGPLWPYGRRTTVFPVWAHKKGFDFPELGFQDGNDSGLSHALKQSSKEMHYCAPFHRGEPEWDAGSCATQAFSDKGKFTSRRSLYPPRQDHQRAVEDVADVAQFAMLNPFDAVSKATPISGAPAQLVWTIPPTVPTGAYVLWMEVAREFDQNAAYDYPSPSGITFGDYGMAYRGQPSVLYKTPIQIEANGDTEASTDRYAGYGDPDGLDGDIRDPDGTISVDVPGSGGARLAIVPGGGYRMRTSARSELDLTPPAAMSGMEVASVTYRSITLDMIAPGDDGLVGPIAGYEIRYAVNTPITEDTFASATEARPSLELAGPGELQTITLDRLLPETTYSIGIRALDNCGNAGPVTAIEATTASRLGAEVDACFIATAAYGSAMAAEIEPLRAFRDRVLRQSVLGELAVQTYYTFGPAVAGVVGESELLRETARAVLAPIVTAARAVR